MKAKYVFTKVVDGALLTIGTLLALPFLFLILLLGGFFGSMCIASVCVVRYIRGCL